MPVYAILAHTEPEVLRRLVARLHPSTVVVHLDSRADEDAFPHAQNVHYVKDRQVVNWGGWSVVKATEVLFGVALTFARTDEYIVLLSGQCYPLRPLSEFEAWLSARQGRQFCAGALALDGTKYSDNRVRKSWYFDVFPGRQRGLRSIAFPILRRLWQFLTPRKSYRAFDGLTIVSGSQWVALTAECVSHIVGGSVAPRLRILLKQSLAPDEIYLHSLVYSSAWGSSGSGSPPTARDGRRTWEFANFHFIDPSLTSILDLGDWERLLASGAFFARKMSCPASLGLMNSLDSKDA